LPLFIRVDALPLFIRVDGYRPATRIGLHLGVCSCTTPWNGG